MDDHAISSMEEIIPDPFWEDLPPPLEPPLVISSDGLIDGVVANGGGEGTNVVDQNQSPSEWSFERLLEEELLTDATPLENFSGSAPHADTVVQEVDHATMAVSTAGDPMEYNTILKRKLDEDLATVALWRRHVHSQPTGVVRPEHSQGSNNSIGGNINFVQNNMRSVSEGPTNRVRNAYIRARLATSSSSRDDPSPSDDDDMDGEVEILGFKLPTEEKVRKRKESNRESARRSRYRKAAHLKEMEDQVAQLKVENSSLLRRLATLNQKYTDATVDNRVLKANMETLRAKVKMAEDALKRATGTMSSSQLSRPSPVPANADASGPILDNIIDYLMNSTDATSTDNNFEPRPTTMTPSFSQLQAEKPAAASTNSAMISRITAHHAVAVELLHKRLGAMPTTASSGVAPPELPAPPSDVLAESTDMGMH